MKKLLSLILTIILLSASVALVGCDMLGDMLGGSDSDTSHTKEYQPITGKFYLYQSADARIDTSNTYFEIDGSKGNFSLKYYEKGILKKQGVFQKVNTYKEKIGYWCDNLHLNLKCDDGTYEHICAYTESFEPLDQFRIIDEYSGGREEYRYLYSQLPFVLGTYLREGATFVEEQPNKNDVDRTKPTLEDYTAELNGKYQLEENCYFYFVCPRGYVIKNGPYIDCYFQYYAPNLDKPLEGFAHGVTYKDSIAPPRVYFSYSTEASYYDALEDTVNALMFGYNTFENDRMIDHWGSIDFSDGQLKSFTFEHLSRSWTDDEWNKYLSDENYQLPDAILYDYVGGTYYKAQ